MCDRCDLFQVVLLCLNSVLLRKSKFHSVLEEEFFPITVQRFDDLNRQTAFEIQEAFKKETWTSAEYVVAMLYHVGQMNLIMNSYATCPQCFAG